MCPIREQLLVAVIHLLLDQAVRVLLVGELRSLLQGLVEPSNLRHPVFGLEHWRVIQVTL